MSQSIPSRITRAGTPAISRFFSSNFLLTKDIGTDDGIGTDFRSLKQHAAGADPYMAVNNDVLRLVQRIAAAFVNDRVAVAGANDAPVPIITLSPRMTETPFFSFGQNGYIAVKKAIAAIMIRLP